MQFAAGLITVLITITKIIALLMIVLSLESRVEPRVSISIANRIIAFVETLERFFVWSLYLTVAYTLVLGRMFATLRVSSRIFGNRLSRENRRLS